MGIRYYAWPLEPEHVDLARRHPLSFCHDDPFGQAWFTANIDNCYLDKAWRGLQLLIADFYVDAEPPRPDRPAAALVAGAVTFDGDGGWEPHVGVLDADGVRAGGDELSLVARSIPAQWQAQPSRASRRGPSSLLVEQDYILEYLEVLRTFVTRLAGEGRGMIYLIG